MFTLAHEGAAAPNAPEHLVWSARRDDDVAAVATARAAALSAAEDEYRRLLYVAMTRAADRLIVCGATTLRGKPAGCWYDLVADALQPPISVVEPADDGDGEVLRYRKAPLESFAATPAEATATPPPALPDWLQRDAPAEAPPILPLSPSSAYDETTPPRGGTGLSRKKALSRGNVVHRLLQSLPDLPAEARAEAARRHLARRAEFDADEQAALAELVHAILDDARFATLFGAHSRAEAPIVGRIPRPGQPPLAVAGQIDRLVVTAQEVLIADYKTNTPAPRRIEDVPPAYVAQLALYRAVLAALYSGTPIRAALVWTEVPDLMEISDDALDAALARLIAG
jgi:ATP-dependent helicase/nuclease subunit A